MMILWVFRASCAEVPGLPRLVTALSRAFWWVVLTRRAYSCIGSRVIRGQCWASSKLEKLWPLGDFCEKICKVMNSFSARFQSENFPRSDSKDHDQNWSRLLKWASKVEESPCECAATGGHKMMILWGFRASCAEVPGLPRLVPGRSRAFLWVVLTRRAYSCIGSRVIRGQCWASWKFEKLWTFEDFWENFWKVMNSFSARFESDNFSRSSIKNHAQNWSRLLQ